MTKPKLKSVFDPVRESQDLDFSTVAGRLEFFRRWAGGKDPMHLYVVDVTVEMVGFLLKEENKELQFKNRARRSKDPTVRGYISEMIRDRWIQEAGSPLVYTEEGLLANGFGRMRAILECRLPQRMTILGPKPDSFVIAMDRGKGRSAADTTVILTPLEEEDRPSVFVKTLRTIHHQITGLKPWFKDNSEEQEILTRRYLDAYMEFSPPILVQQDHAAFRMGPVLAAFMYARVVIKDPEKLRVLSTLWMRVINNDRLRPGEVAHLMHRKITRYKGIGKNGIPRQIALIRQLLHGIAAETNQRHLKGLEAKLIKEFEDEVFRGAYLKKVGGI